MSIKKTFVSKPFLTLPKAKLSEGPSYNPQNNSLLWVDIIPGEVHRVFLPIEGAVEYSAAQMKEIEGSHQVVKVEDSVGVIGLTNNPDLYIAGCKKGVGFVNFETGEFKYKLEYPAETHNEKYRSNDGAVDQKGNFWVGTMSNFDQPGSPSGGSLYRINTDFTIDTLLSGDCKIPNGLAWYENKVYWTDSLTFTIWKFDYDAKTGQLSNRQPHLNMKDHLPDVESPEPDGMVMTTTGDIYAAVYSTSTVYRFNIKGEMLEAFSFPAKLVTCPTLGGENFNELFVTTAALTAEGGQADSSDLGGSIFRVILGPDVKGQAKNVWTGPLE